MDVICLKGCDISRYSNHSWCALLPGLQFLTCLDIFAVFRSCVLVFFFFFCTIVCFLFLSYRGLELRYDMTFPCHSRTIALKMSFFFFFPLPSLLLSPRVYRVVFREFFLYKKEWKFIFVSDAFYFNLVLLLKTSTLKKYWLLGYSWMTY